MFSKTCEYSIKAMVFIAGRSTGEKRVGLQEIARETGSPEPFVAKILQQLSRHGLVDSHKGPNGGFVMNAEQLSTVKLSDIVNTIDGDAVYTGCGLGLKQCSEKEPCPVHDKFKRIRNDLRKMLQSTLVADLAKELSNGKTVLQR